MYWSALGNQLSVTLMSIPVSRLKRSKELHRSSIFFFSVPPEWHRSLTDSAPCRSWPPRCRGGNPLWWCSWPACSADTQTRALLKDTQNNRTEELKGVNGERRGDTKRFKRVWMWEARGYFSSSFAWKVGRIKATIKSSLHRAQWHCHGLLQPVTFPPQGERLKLQCRLSNVIAP